MRKPPLSSIIEASEVPQPMIDGVGATDPGPRNVLLDLQNPDVLTPPRTDRGTIPNLKFSFAMGHYVENTGETPLRFLEMFKSNRFADVSLHQWMALTPPELVQGTLHLNQTVMNVLQKQKQLVVI